MNNLAILKITISKKYKPSWELFKKIMRNNPNYSYNIDLRKSSKIMPPVAIAANCCGTILKIKQKKDFPLKNKKCKCGKQYLIEWELI